MITEETLNAMETYGGSFVKTLAELYRRADPTNKKRLEQCFKEYFTTYEKIARSVKK